VVALDGNADAARAEREQAEAELATLQEGITPLQTEINRLSRQFWVSKDQVKASNYDLSASRYRQIEQDEVFYEKPTVTLERLRKLETAAMADATALEKMLVQS
jgi:type I restriction enzyme M protein